MRIAEVGSCKSQERSLNPYSNGTYSMRPQVEEVFGNVSES